MKRINLSIRKAFIAIASIGALGILAYYYFAVSIPEKEGELNNRGFRILARIEQNINEKKTNVQRTIDLFYSKNKYFKLPALEKNRASNSVVDSAGLIEKNSIPQGFLFDGLKISGWINGKRVDKNKRSKFLPYFDNYRNQWILRFFGDYYRHLSKPLPSDSLVVYDYDFNAFLNGILSYRKDFFQEYLILQNNNVVYQSFPFVYEGKNILTNIDTKNNNHKKLLSDFLQKDTLAGKQYYIFYHPFNKSSDANFILCGLVPVEKYNRDKYLLDIEEVIWLLLMFLLAAFSLPFIKMLTVSRFERIQYLDIIKLGIALIAGTFITAMAILLSAFLQGEEERQRSEILSLNKTLRQRFTSETGKILKEIELHEDRLCSDHSAYKQWIVTNDTSPYSDSSLVGRYFNRGSSFHQTEVFLLIDSTGENWSAFLKKGHSSPDPNLWERQYVKVFLDNQAGQTTNELTTGVGSSSQQAQYYIQPIYSWLDQQNLVMVSKPSDPALARKISQELGRTRNAYITALETSLFSLTKTAMADELSFCILDQAGNVLIHSDDKRNLRENFIEESGKHRFVREVIANRMDTTMEMRYYGNHHLAYFSPMEGMPFTMVTLYDKTHYQDAMTNQVTFALLMLILLGLTILLIFLVTHLITVRLTYLKRQKINLRWLRFTDINIRGFAQLIVSLLAPTFFSFIFLFDSRLIFTSFLIPFITLALSAHAVFLVQRVNYSNSLYKDRIERQYRIFYGVCTAAIAGLLAGHIFFNGPSILTEMVGIVSIFFLLITTLLTIDPALFHRTVEKTGTPFKFSVKRINDSIVNRLVAQKELRAHYAVITVFLLLYNLSVFPARNLLLTSVRQEREMARKRNSLEIVTKINDREKWLVRNFPKFVNEMESRPETTGFDLLKSGIYSTPGDDRTVELILKENAASTTQKRAQEGKEADPAKDKFAPDDFTSFYSALVNLPNLDYDDYEVKRIFMNRNKASDSANPWSWDTSAKNLEFKFANTLSSYLQSVKIHLPILAGTWEMLSIGYQVLYISLALLAMITLYSVLFYLHRKITLYEYYPPGKSLEEERKADKTYLLDNVANGTTNLIVISLPGTGVVNEIVGAIKNKGYTKVAFKDDELKDKVPFQTFWSSQQPVKKIVLLTFFDLQTPTSKSTDDSMKLLARHFQDNETKVIWVTSTDPCEQVSILSRNTLELYKVRAANKEKPVEEIYILEQEKEKMLKVLDDFEKINYSLEDNEGPGRQAKAPYTSKYIEDEFRYGLYFEQLRDNVVQKDILKTYFKTSVTGTATQYVHRFDLAEELFVLKVQDMAQNYYYSIWATLNVQEKYVLYDFASDEITNYKNIFILSDLERRGILYFCDIEKTLKVFNKSFRNFILTVVDPDEALLLEKQVNTSGTWEIVRMVLIIFFVFLGVFLFYTEHSIFSRIVGVTTALTSLLPTVVSFFANIRGTRVAK
jgi:hypothetical protein